MNLQDIVEPLPTTSQHSQGSRVSRAETWDSCKERIYEVYITKENTLSTTMKLFEKEYGLKACTRTWKSKLKEWKYDKYSTGKDKPIIISNVEERERDEERMTVNYPLPDRFMASAAMFRTVRNDCSLFFAARSAGLVRILVRDFPDGLKGEYVVEGRLSQSKIYPSCDYCPKFIGVYMMYYCKTCPSPLHIMMPRSCCCTCYSNKKPICLAQGHELHQIIISVPSECRIAKNTEEENWCNALNCGKKISGLYFREFRIKKTLHLAYFILRLLCL
ncbi:hypothetical protein NA56DRAFT_222879 [Hyaloscypha hepaticicola]|uniref:Clr5 domain-containing protein n=1 Tax=Hyaloscypha hepaticicola TaxID=2082293 RepID=A0A2J6PXW5_9HELO|nr:hypothetical protein NA56DRAFT_222879 [Hyaloscypha hepaticicola]